MRMIKVVTVAIAVIAGAGSGMAQTQPDTATKTVHIWNNPTEWWYGHCPSAAGPRFQDNELSFDMFGSFLAKQNGFTEMFDTSLRRDSNTWGGGVGLNYFMCKCVGLGGDINIPNNGGNFVDSFVGSVIVRLPIEPIHLAPYLFGGGGKVTEPNWEWTEHFGVGLEFRINRLTGIFADARYMWIDRASDKMLIRAGMRFVF
jgi:hypothetical protein